MARLYAKCVLMMVDEGSAKVRPDAKAVDDAAAGSALGAATPTAPLFSAAPTSGASSLVDHTRTRDARGARGSGRDAHVSLWVEATSSSADIASSEQWVGLGPVVSDALAVPIYDGVTISYKSNSDCGAGRQVIFCPRLSLGTQND